MVSSVGFRLLSPILADLSFWLRLASEKVWNAETFGVD